MSNKNLKTWDQAKAKARGEEAPSLSDEPSVALGQIASQGVAVEQFDPAAIMEALQSGAMEAGEQIIELKQGEMIRGQLLGEGVPATIEDLKTHEPRQVKTWRMRLASGANVSFLGAAQLDRQLPAFVGRKGMTLVARGGQRQTRKGMNLTEYFVAGPPASAPRLGDEKAMPAIPVKTGDGQ